MAETAILFTSIGLSEQKAKETLKNEALTSALKDAIVQVIHHLDIYIIYIIYITSSGAVSQGSGVLSLGPGQTQRYFSFGCTFF